MKEKNCIFANRKRKNRSMRKVFGIGETVLDIIFRNNQPIGAYPGGSTFNAIISLGRSGVDTTFISETGADRVGDSIIAFLQENGVNAENVRQYPGTKSPLSLAFLNEQNDAEYVFYKDHPNDQIEFEYPKVNPDDIVLFGSYYALNPVIRQQVYGFLHYAHEQGAILYYDINFRAAHANEAVKLRSNLLDNLELSTIVRGSHEDFQVLYKKDDPDVLYRQEISFYCKNFICTRGEAPIALRAQGNLSRSYDVEKVEAVSTIGAGDNFNAGFIFGLIRENISLMQLREGITPEQWDRLIAYGQHFSAACCKSIFNYISPEEGERLKEKNNEDF